MVKKLKYLLLFFPLLFTLNVKASTMPSPSFVNARFNDGYIETSQPGYSNVEYFTSGQWYYKSNYLLGGVSSIEYVDRINYGWNNPSLCSDNSELELKGSIAVIQDFFNREQYDVEFYSNGSKMSCNFNFDNTVTPTFSKLDFTCTGRSGGGLNLYIYSLSHHYNDTYMVGFKKEITYSCDVSNGAIIENNNDNTQSIINNQNSNTQSIINNQNSNTQEIIDNQNQNNQELIDSQLSCTNGSNYSFPNQNRRLSASGTLTTDSGYMTSDYLPVPKSISNIITSSNPYFRVCFYRTNSQSSYISCFTRGETITIPQDANYFRFNIQTNTYPWKFCYNGNDSIYNSLTDTSQPNTNQDIDDMNDMVASDTPISDLITMPLTLINAYINGVNTSCSPVNLGNLYGTDLILPCINLQQRLGTNLWNTIDIFFSIFMCYNIGMLFITAFDGLTSLRDDFEGLYQPRHADTGYRPKHGG